MILRPVTLPVNRWQLADPAPADFHRRFAHLHPVLGQILYNRGLSTAGAIQAFLEGRYLHSQDPFLLPDMQTAVDRIGQAIAADEAIAVYGDFDADGVTSTVLLVEALRGLGLSRERAQPYIPDRVDEGYGLNDDALTSLKARGIDLVITVDCGIRSVREVEHANAIGLDVIITDHHSLGPALPPAVAVINPKRPESRYPELMLAGVGIAYKLAEALYQALPARVRGDLERLLDLVAIGTVADLAPLQGENRWLVIKGLEVLNRLERPGIAALAQLARLSGGNLTAESIGFGLGPRINAAGRLAHAYDAARLLAVQNTLQATQLAQGLNQLNQQRQRLTAELSTMAEERVAEEAPILVVADPAFQSGIVGLVASRLAERHYRPAIVIEQGDVESRGSCRSIPEFHITAALDETADLLERHGGHAAAAGFTLRNENLPAFTERMTALAAAAFEGVTLHRTLEADAAVALADIDWALFELLQQLEPTGAENPTPVFLTEGARVIQHRAVGREGAHLQLTVADDRGELGAIAFRQGDWADRMPAYVDLLYTLNINEWNGRRRLQLQVKDLRPAAAG